MSQDIERARMNRSLQDLRDFTELHTAAAIYQTCEGLKQQSDGAWRQWATFINPVTGAERTIEVITDDGIPYEFKMPAPWRKLIARP